MKILVKAWNILEETKKEALALQESSGTNQPGISYDKDIKLPSECCTKINNNI